jgi:hypothetical protein
MIWLIALLILLIPGVGANLLRLIGIIILLGIVASLFH